MTTANELVELMAREEELLPELQDYVAEGPFGPMLKHPLVFEIMMIPHHCAMLNERYRAKVKQTRKAYTEGDWHSFVYLHERAYRLDAFCACSWQMDGEAYWKLLGSVWVDSENIWQSRAEWRSMFEADADGREHMMSEDDRQALAMLPPTITVYRGYCYDEAKNGLSWTLDKERAKWFASRLHQEGEPKPRVARGLVAVGDVLAYHTGRNEQEIVVFPEHVKGMEVAWIQP